MARTTEKTMSKMEAVRRGLSDLGNEAKPVQLQTHIKEHYGMDMGTDHISTCKGSILKGKKGKKSKGHSSKRALKTMHAEWSAGNARPSTASMLSQQVAMLKAVTGTIGKEEAKRIIDLL